jgi:metal-responsive CopG/Arc/MetJ family transcriptional regulator
MKMKISVSLSSQAVKLIDSLPNKPARSEIIEEALVLYFKSRKIIVRDRSDMDILNSRSSTLNQEALDVLDFQSFGRK